MWIAVVGIDHTTAPIDLREQLACSPARALEVMSAARPNGLECVLLSTCNRIELYAAGSGRFDEATRTQLLHVLCALGENRQVDVAEVRAHNYCFTGKAAASHLFEVACGLRSLILGEPQIQGQVAEALEQAHVAGASGPVVSALFRAAIVAGKRARSETGISRSAVSVSHVAVQLARQLFPRLREATVLLIGSGQMSELAARNLRDNGAGQLIIINRTLEHAREFASRNGAAYRPMEELAAALADADVVISSTHAPHALITVDMMREVLKQKQERENNDQGGREANDQGDREGAPLPYTNDFEGDVVDRDCQGDRRTHDQGDRKGAPLPYTSDVDGNDEDRVGAHPCGRPGHVSGGRPGSSLLLIDIALPRDIEPAVGALPGVYLYNLDDLQTGVSQGMEQRVREVEHVCEIIAGEVGTFERWLRTRRAAGAISKLRQHAEELRQQELERTLRQLAPALSGREIDVIQELSKSLVNKLLHTPTLRLKEAVSDGGGQAYAEAFHYIFDLEVQHEEEYYDWDTSEQAGDDSDALGYRTSPTVMAWTGGED